ncbi:MAG: hypothetical protein KDA63_00630 [Planctomycetales bacterium]|nr:hypothetical protein [Planctomycetales bacterium]
MWQCSTTKVNDGHALRFALLCDGASTPYSEVLARWHDDASFRSYFNDLLVECPFPSFRWETPPVTSSTLNRPFEFVVVRSDGLARPVEESAFAAFFDTDKDVVAFPNLGGDAVLVVPCPLTDANIYGHLGSFVRSAPETQIQSLWRTVAHAMNERVSDRPVWLSTAGGGVAWLHVRLDDRPKYYSYTRYRQGVF